jgi:eukaryotic-like serine/threonine-protein kinase
MTVPVNGILYPLGIFLVLLFAMPVARTLRRLDQADPVPEHRLRQARHRAITLGHGVAGVGLALWIIAGWAFPIGIHLIVGQFRVEYYLRFVISMFACGVISCCLPFLATTWLSVRVFFPALLASSSPDPTEQRRLRSLAWFAGLYLFTSPVAPLVTILLILFSGNPSADTRSATIYLIMISIAGFLAAYITWQRIRDDLNALSVVTRPPDMIGTTTETVEAF